MTDRISWAKAGPAALGLALIGAGVCVLLGVAPSLEAATGGDRIIASNIAYLEAARNAAAADFADIAAMLAIVDIVASTEVGFDFLVSASVEAGQALAALARVLEWAAAITALSAAASEALLILTHVAAAAAQPLLGAAVAALGAYAAARAVGADPRLSRVARRVATLSVTAFLLCHIAAPYAVQMGALASNTAMTLSLNEARSGLAAAHRDVAAASDDASLSEWGKRAAVTDSYASLRKHASEQRDNVFEFVAAKAATTLTAHVITPLLFLFVFIHLLKYKFLIQL
ncbi:MAG: hypothetical protein AAFN79_21290 [Pseudomonadota bacterium]